MGGDFLIAVGMSRKRAHNTHVWSASNASHLLRDLERGLIVAIRELPIEQFYSLVSTSFFCKVTRKLEVVVFFWLLHFSVDY